MTAKPKKSSLPWVDPDDAPEVTDQWVSVASLYDGNRLVRRGRPVGSLKATPTWSRLFLLNGDNSGTIRMSLGETK